jgi:multidrug efflux pump subunit AcrA (membrane-fusion protein)
MKLLTTLLILAAAAPARAGAGHEHPHEPGAAAAHAGGPVVLGETRRRNLELQTAEASVVELAPALEVPAVLVLPPERHARITAPFEGRVDGLLAKLGDHVRRGQPLLSVTPLAVGSPAQELRAPLDGVVFDLAAVVGTAFKPDTTLMQTGDYAELLARGVFYQSPELAKIRIGQKAAVTLDVFPGERFPGAVQRVDPGHDVASPFFHIYALIPNAADKLHPNYRARLSVEIGEAQSVVAVPVRAVLGSLGALFVYIETEPGHYERREVVTGIRSGGLVEIVEGVLPGDRVVTVGNYQLQHVLPEGTGAAPGDDGHGHAH